MLRTPSGGLEGLDLDRIVARFEAWWQGAIVDRPPVTLRVQPEDGVADAPPGTDLEARWFDVDGILARFEAALARSVWVGDGVPILMPNLGPDLCATLFGATLEFADETSWCRPLLGSCREILGRMPDFGNRYWSFIRRLTRESLARGRGRWLTALPDLHTNADLLAALRGPEALCYECADDLDTVAAACRHVTGFFGAMYDDLYHPIAATGQPCTSWIPVLHRGRSYNTQCDFCALISPAMFNEAVLPSLRREMQALERTIYHLDGPGALVHLDHLLVLPELTGVQWMFGSGQGPGRRWIEVFQRIQQAGKCLELVCEDLDDARAIAEHLRPEGVWFHPWSAVSRDEAQAFIAWVQRWAAGGL